MAGPRPAPVLSGSPPGSSRLLPVMLPSKCLIRAVPLGSHLAAGTLHLALQSPASVKPKSQSEIRNECHFAFRIRVPFGCSAFSMYFRTLVLSYTFACGEPASLLVCQDPIDSAFAIPHSALEIVLSYARTLFVFQSIPHPSPPAVVSGQWSVVG
jgi:hypothetical protein